MWHEQLDVTTIFGAVACPWLWSVDVVTFCSVFTSLVCVSVCGNCSLSFSPGTKLDCKGLVSWLCLICGIFTVRKALFWCICECWFCLRYIYNFAVINPLPLSFWVHSEELEHTQWGWEDGNMAVSTQLGLLLWKNFTYRRRQTVSRSASNNWLTRTMNWMTIL